MVRSGLFRAMWHILLLALLAQDAGLAEHLKVRLTQTLNRMEQRKR